MTEEGLAQIFLDACPAASRANASTLERELAAICEAAHAVWPTIDVPDRDFVAHVGAAAREGVPVRRDHAADLYLACACARGLPAAMRAFDPILREVVQRAVARIDASSAFQDLVAQDLRTRLLLGAPPKIAEYSGQAPLAPWLKTSAIRSALNFKRGKAEEAHESVSSGMFGVATGPDTALLRARFRETFKEALAAALARLSTQDRAMLCLNLRDGLSVDKLAAVYGIGRSTVARHLAAARETVERETRRELTSRLNLTPSELESLGADVRSNIDVSLAGMLAQA